METINNLSKTFIIKYLKKALQPQKDYSITYEGSINAPQKVVIKLQGGRERVPKEFLEIIKADKEKTHATTTPNPNNPTALTVSQPTPPAYNSAATLSPEPQITYDKDYFQERFEWLLGLREYTIVEDEDDETLYTFKDEAFLMSSYEIDKRFRKFIKDNHLPLQDDVIENIVWHIYMDLGIKYDVQTLRLILFSLLEKEFIALLKLLNIDDDTIQDLLAFRRQYNYIGAEEKNSNSPLTVKE